MCLILVKVSSYLPGCYQAENATDGVPGVPGSRTVCVVYLGSGRQCGSGKVSNKGFINIHHTQSINNLHTCLIPK